MTYLLLIVGRDATLIPLKSETTHFAIHMQPGQASKVKEWKIEKSNLETTHPSRQERLPTRTKNQKN